MRNRRKPWHCRLAPLHTEPTGSCTASADSPLIARPFRRPLAVSAALPAVTEGFLSPRKSDSRFGNGPAIWGVLSAGSGLSYRIGACPRRRCNVRRMARRQVVPLIHLAEPAFVCPGSISDNRFSKSMSVISDGQFSYQQTPCQLFGKLFFRYDFFVSSLLFIDTASLDGILSLYI